MGQADLEDHLDSDCGPRDIMYNEDGDDTHFAGDFPISAATMFSFDQESYVQRDEGRYLLQYSYAGEDVVILYRPLWLRSGPLDLEAFRPFLMVTSVINSIFPIKSLIYIRVVANTVS